MSPLPPAEREGLASFGAGSFSTNSLSEKVASFSDHLRLAREAAELQRAHNRSEQGNESNTPSARICAWEKLHGLKLPSEPSHPILRAVANGTLLSIAQIREEQAARAALQQVTASDRAVDLTIYATRKR